MTAREKIEQALRDGDAIPAGPAVMGRIGALCKDPNASARDLGKVLQLDASLTSRVLKQVNSSFYGLSATIKTVTHAVVILGFQEVKNLAFSVPVANFFDENKDARGIDVEALWNESIITACIARSFSYDIHHPVPEQVFVSAMLSKTGMVILNSILGESYRKVVEASVSSELLPQLETKILGINHVDVGYMMAEKWQFPEDLIRSIRYQYDPIVDDEIMTEPGLIYVARNILEGLNAEQPTEETLATLPPSIVEAFEITPESARAAIEKAASEFEDVKSMLCGE